LYYWQMDHQDIGTYHVYLLCLCSSCHCLRSTATSKALPCATMLVRPVYHKSSNKTIYFLLQMVYSQQLKHWHRLRYVASYIQFLEGSLYWLLELPNQLLSCTLISTTLPRISKLWVRSYIWRGLDGNDWNRTHLNPR
jgi:hypothetical protein